MAANTSPIFTSVPVVSWAAAGALTTANTTKDGSSGTIQTIFTADATDGSYVAKIVARAAGTNVATVLRVFINNGSVNTSAANNKLYTELTLAATTLSEVAAQAPYEIPLNIALPAGYTIFVTIGTAVSAGYHITAVGGNY